MKKYSLAEKLVYLRYHPVLGKIAFYLLRFLYGATIPCSVRIGPDFKLPHGGCGVVIYESALIGARVKIYQGVTLGQADVRFPGDVKVIESIIVEDDVIIGAGAKVLCSKGTLRIGKGTIIGANAVLLTSTGENEIWAGIPARRVGFRKKQ